MTRRPPRSKYSAGAFCASLFTSTDSTLVIDGGNLSSRAARYSLLPSAGVNIISSLCLLLYRGMTTIPSRRVPK